jgi:hypothetical protein
MRIERRTMPSLPKHPLRPIATLAAIGASAALVACGGGDDDSADAEANFEDAQVEFAQCMRERGIDIPDPEPGQSGIQIRLPEGVDPDSESFQNAQEDCEPIIQDAIPEGERPDPSEVRDQGVKLAQCMREHGVNMPDPQVDSEGRVTFGSSPQGGEGSDSGREDILSDPDFEEAQEACQEEVGGFGFGGDSGEEEAPSTDESGSGS